MSEAPEPDIWAPPVLANPAEAMASSEQAQHDLQERIDAELARGFAEGVRAGEEQAAQKLRVADGLLAWLARPFAKTTEEIEEAVTQLAITIARQVIRKEVRTDRNQIVAVIREALGMLPAASRSVEISVHPEDSALLRDLLAESGDERVWELLDDALLGRGEFRIRAEQSELDGTLEGRLQEVIAGLAEDMRRQPRASDE